jgi:arylsulfatase A-like enzyme
MSDDHGANAISIYQSRLASVFQTANIDRIGKEGAVSESCHCTNAICTPSRATILTGMYPHKNGVRTLADQLSTELNTFPQMMRESGYQTAVVGKWHVHSEPQGFDYYDVLPGQGLYFNPYFLDESTDKSLFHSNKANHGKPHEGHVTDIITDKCLDWLNQRDRSKPFMLLCHHKAPHDNFEYHPGYEHMFDDVVIPEPESLFEDKSHRSSASRAFGSTVSESNPKRNAVTTMSRPDYPTGPLQLEGLSPLERTKAAYQKYLKDYLRVVKGIDDNVGRLLDYLEKEQLLDNTIVVYTSDQGMFLGEHDYIDKRWIFEEALRMPFLVRYPKEIKPGTVIRDMINNVDFAPTLLDYAELKQTDEMPGRSFREVLKGNKPSDWENVLYYRYWMHLSHHDVPAHYGIRTDKYKLIFYYGMALDATIEKNQRDKEPTESGWELYNLVQDPQELINVYHDPLYASVVQELKTQLRQLKQDVGDDDHKYPELLVLQEKE